MIVEMRESKTLRHDARVLADTSRDGLLRRLHESRFRCLCNISVSLRFLTAKFEIENGRLDSVADPELSIDVFEIQLNRSRDTLTIWQSPECSNLAETG
jgi:hypothetical protein